MSTFSIRLARRGDARAMALLSRDLIETGLGWRWTPQRVSASLRDRATNGLVAVDGPRVVGFALMKYLDEQAHLLLLAVLPERRRAGIGRALLAWLESSALVAGIATIDLEVRAGNDTARRFYRTLGFEELRVVPQYYGGREAALHMRRRLRPTLLERAAPGNSDLPVWRPPP
jgi:ribosomal-protein-alanine N-acetyltransferase